MKRQGLSRGFEYKEVRGTTGRFSGEGEIYRGEAPRASLKRRVKIQPSCGNILKYRDKFTCPSDIHHRRLKNSKRYPKEYCLKRGIRMSFVKGTASFVCFSVEGNLPDRSLEYLAQRVAAFSFKDIDDTYDEASLGWVSVLNMFDSTFSHASFSVGDHIVLTLRVDERKVSPAILKKYIKKEEERVRVEKEVPRLSKSTRSQIKERVYAELLRKSFPVPSVFDVVWNLSESRVFLFTTNKKVHSLMEDYFKECFGVLLKQQIPYIMAETIIDNDKLLLLENLQYQSYAD